VQLSMTGHGQSRYHDDHHEISVEIRTVNSRHLKLNVYADLDVASQSKIEGLIRGQIHRGTVTVRVNVKSLSAGEFELNEPLIRSYWTRLSEIAGQGESVNLESLLALPGVVVEKAASDPEALWPRLEKVVVEAIENLQAMKKREGEDMEQDMLSNLDLIEKRLDAIRTLAPSVSQNYSKRLTDRINGLLEKYDITVEAADVIREVGVFAERVDNSEETVRLGTHLNHFRETIASTPKAGRKLDFLVQEILRETNTIGSKANDSGIATEVVEIKTSIERIREMVQNIE